MRLSSVLCKVADLTKQYSNLPESYIKRAMEQVYWRTPKGRQYLKREVKRKKYYFGIHRPWTTEFQMENERGTMRKKVFVEPIRDWSFFKGDRVEVLVGQDKGKQGIICQVFQERNWIIVEGLNCELKLIGKNKDFPGIYIKSEKPLLVTNEVALVDPSDLKSSPIEWRYTEAGQKVRVSVRTGRIIPIPRAAEETYDYKTKASYIESEKDTKASEVTAITFEPALKTFEMDIMEQMGIKEDRVPDVYRRLNWNTNQKMNMKMSQAKVSSSAVRSQTTESYNFPRGTEVKLHIHIKHKVKGLPLDAALYRRRAQIWSALRRKPEVKGIGDRSSPFMPKPIAGGTESDCS